MSLVQDTDRDNRLAKVLELVTKMIELSDPFTYKEFNIQLKSPDSAKLLAYEKDNPEVGLVYYEDDNSYGISTLSIIATITDILIGKRLAFIAEQEDPKYKKGQITGVTWWANPEEDK